MADAFDVIPFEDIRGDWKKLGSGSFGNVYKGRLASCTYLVALIGTKGSYLGIDVAIKEVLPSSSYDVAKYFEREWRLMKEARHPNVVLYLGLSRAPPPDGRIFIISEYIENGNLRQYIFDKNKPFPWRLRISFATDIARALAYLHARKCIHRDLKGENLLVTANGRLKITDFGFARIAARNEEESKRLTFCGTDSYMSPEILLGHEFDLPTDIFSLGIIFCEIASRRLADDRHFKRTGPTFGIDADEVNKLANTGCPPAFLSLCLSCLTEDPSVRPTTRQILERLQDIEAEVLARPETEDLHLGSVKFMTGGKRPTAPRIPSFGIGIGKDIRHPTPTVAEDIMVALSSGEEDSDEELSNAVEGLNISMHLNSDWSNGEAINGDSENSTSPLLNTSSSTYSDYSITVVRGHAGNATETVPPSLSSVLTIRPCPDPNATPDPITPGATSSTDDSMTPVSSDSILSAQTYRTAQSSIPSTTRAIKGHSSIRSVPMLHRFTLIRPGVKRSGSTSPAKHLDGGWNPLELFFSSALLVQKCDICAKRIGWKPVLECDDCGLRWVDSMRSEAGGLHLTTLLAHLPFLVSSVDRAHVKCGEVAPRDCGLSPIRSAQQHGHGTRSPSPLLKGQQIHNTKRHSVSAAVTR